MVQFSRFNLILPFIVATHITKQTTLQLSRHMFTQQKGLLYKYLGPFELVLNGKATSVLVAEEK
jgi:hypothetical protein